MKRATSIILIMILLLAATICVTSCGKQQPSEDDSHRDPRQMGEVPEKETFKTAHDLYKPREEEYRSPFSKSTGPPKSLVWLSLDSALNQIEDLKSKKKAILYFTYKHPTKECLKIENEVFTDEEVLKYSFRWVFVRVNIDVQPELAALYNIESVPTFKALSHKGHEYKSYSGPVTAEEFARVLIDWY